MAVCVPVRDLKNTAEFVGLVERESDVAVTKNGYGIMHRTDSIFPTSRIQFEDAEFNAPANPDAYLTDLYRNYMQIPPKEKQIVHSVFILPELIEEEGERN